MDFEAIKKAAEGYQARYGQVPAGHDRHPLRVL